MNEALVYQAHYTKSDPILNNMSGMLDLRPHYSILEPCGGDGVFVDKILEKVPNANISVFELNPQAVIGLKSKYNGEANIQIKEPIENKFRERLNDSIEYVNNGNNEN